MTTFSSLQEGLSRYLTPDQLEKLASVTVGIAGCGGLGSNCAFMLARSGVRNFVIVDYDVVDTSNLNRQFFFADQVGMTKVEVGRTNLLRIDSTLNITVHNCQITPTTAPQYFAGCDIIVEALDSIDGKKMMAALYLSDPRLFVSASGMAGWGEPYMQKRKIRDDAVLVGDFTTDIADHPPMAPKVLMAAAMQADVVLTHILGK
ncbi:sulfur carrier protein ThiS adenylyltransferase ThiF [Halodesulfovibrio marinisediminis]|uniref:Sulfur carrier protein ThiS adenylyltransferase n=1 Tax=Halodesulfovibrio marinisediminis DSM 17456 TaxID=1121457 RepID=A0A1N6DK64_9BACT|nr:sulfur carrier protein ThiS adenylyltransferase ThiF [Halodesulfovibrio marinisediminis]SIN71126.1 sulfur carrier protein ThiS adenylyltransferase [Halodesulfovibrio marinisediminis DSM 17456]